MCEETLAAGTARCCDYIADPTIRTKDSQILNGFTQVNGYLSKYKQYINETFWNKLIQKIKTLNEEKYKVAFTTGPAETVD